MPPKKAVEEPLVAAAEPEPEPEEEVPPLYIFYRTNFK